MGSIKLAKFLLVFGVTCGIASSFSGCIWAIRKRVAQAERQARELERPPFVMPNEFPVPDDAVAVARPLKGNTIIFETFQTLRQLENFYDSKFKALGLLKYENSAHFPGGFQLSYENWPGACILTVGAIDNAFNSAVDKRVVSAKLDSCR